VAVTPVPLPIMLFMDSQPVNSTQPTAAAVKIIVRTSVIGVFIITP
jgi:hypothetical protein